jgi:hypothetical protein
MLQLSVDIVAHSLVMLPADLDPVSATSARERSILRQRTRRWYTHRRFRCRPWKHIHDAASLGAHMR